MKITPLTGFAPILRSSSARSSCVSMSSRARALTSSYPPNESKVSFVSPGLTMYSPRSSSIPESRYLRGVSDNTRMMPSISVYWIVFPESISIRGTPSRTRMPPPLVSMTTPSSRIFRTTPTPLSSTQAELGARDHCCSLMKITSPLCRSTGSVKEKRELPPLTVRPRNIYPTSSTAITLIRTPSDIDSISPLASSRIATQFLQLLSRHLLGRRQIGGSTARRSSNFEAICRLRRRRACSYPVAHTVPVGTGEQATT